MTAAEPPRPAEPAPPPRRRSPWPWILLALGLGFFALVLVIWAGVSDLVPSTEGRRVVLDHEEDNQGVFVEIPVEGVIVDAKAGGPNPVAWLKSCLENAAKEPDLKGILLRVNSPGGGIRASDRMLDYLQKFKAEHDVPVVVYMKDVAASGGYYVSMCADWIVAHEDTITASIGVIWSVMNWQGLMNDKLGIKWTTIKSADMKDIGSPDRQMTAKEVALIQSFVSEAFDEFVRLVVEGRKGKGKVPVTEESVRALKSTILSGRHAYEKGLVDELGFRENAVAKLKQLAGIERADIVEYLPPLSFFEELLSVEGPTTPIQRQLRRLELLHAEGSPLLALWER